MLPARYASVPELTRIAGIQLNKRVSLQRQRTELSFFTGQFPQASGPTLQSRHAIILRLAALFEGEHPTSGIADGSVRKKTKKIAYTQRDRRAIS